MRTESHNCDLICDLRLHRKKRDVAACIDFMTCGGLSWFYGGGSFTHKNCNNARLPKRVHKALLVHGTPRVFLYFLNFEKMLS